MIYPNLPHLIGLTGAARAGKDTVGRMLREMHGYQPIAFANPMRSMIQAMAGPVLYKRMQEEREESMEELCGGSYRSMMQTLGTEWGRDLVHADIWIRLLEQHQMRPGCRHVITDVRFDNEAEWVIGQHGVMVDIYNPRVADLATHRSQMGVNSDLVTAEITNDGSLGELRSKVEALAEALNRGVTQWSSF